MTSKGIQMPALLYGTAWKKERTSEWVLIAVKAGFRGIDTACQPKHYNEKQVGDAIQLLQQEGWKREDLFVQTKFTPQRGQDPHSIPYDINASVSTQVRQSFEVSKSNLQTNYVDSLVLHSPMAHTGRRLNAWKAMEAIHHEGGTRQLGISNCYNLEVLKHLYANAVIKPAVIQNRFYRKTHYDSALRQWCSDHGVIYQSFWTLTANPHILSSDIVQNIANDTNKTPAQILFRYLIQSDIVVLTGTTSIQHMREDLAIFEFTLSSADMLRLRSLFEDQSIQS